MGELKIEATSQGKTAEVNNLEKAREFAQKRVTLKSQNLVEISREIKEKYDLSFIDASKIAMSTNSELRIARAKELLETNDRVSTIEILKKELWGEGKLGRQKLNEHEKIAAIIVDKAIKTKDKK